MVKRKRSQKQRKQPTRQAGTAEIRLSTRTVLLIGVGGLLVGLILGAGFVVGRRQPASVRPIPRLPSPAAQVQSAGQNPAVVQPTATPRQAQGTAPPARKPTYDSPPPMTIDPSKTYTATIKTEKGDIVIKLRPDLAPQHVNNFVFLAREGFYNGLWFHRVIPGFIAQAGDPKGDSTGGPGYLLPHEITDTPHRAGTVAMARLSDPFNPDRDSSGSQFYIVLEDSQEASALDGQYTIFGEVVEGLDVARHLTPREPGDAYPGDQIKTIVIEEE